LNQLTDFHEYWVVRYSIEGHANIVYYNSLQSAMADQPFDATLSEMATALCCKQTMTEQTTVVYPVTSHEKCCGTRVKKKKKKKKCSCVAILLLSEHQNLSLRRGYVTTSHR
jgi:hypothetical protein